MENAILDYLRNNLKLDRQDLIAEVTTGSSAEARYYALSDQRDFHRSEACRHENGNGILIELYHTKITNACLANAIVPDYDKRIGIFITIQVTLEFVKITNYEDTWFSDQAFPIGLEPPFPATEYICINDQQVLDKIIKTALRFLR
jgi:hypothetical protein